MSPFRTIVNLIYGDKAKGTVKKIISFLAGITLASFLTVLTFGIGLFFLGRAVIQKKEQDAYLAGIKFSKKHNSSSSSSKSEPQSEKANQTIEQLNADKAKQEPTIQAQTIQEFSKENFDLNRKQKILTKELEEQRELNSSLLMIYQRDAGENPMDVLEREKNEDDESWSTEL